MILLIALVSIAFIGLISCIYTLIILLFNSPSNELDDVISDIKSFIDICEKN